MMTPIGSLYGVKVLTDSDDVRSSYATWGDSGGLVDTPWFEQLVKAAETMLVTAQTQLHSRAVELRFVLRPNVLLALLPDGLMMDPAITQITATMPYAPPRVLR